MHNVTSLGETGKVFGDSHSKMGDEVFVGAESVSFGRYQNLRRC